MIFNFHFLLAFSRALRYTVYCVNFSGKWGEKMANIKTAKKRIHIIQKKTARNRRVKSHLKAIIKNFDAAIADSDLVAAKEKLILAEKRLKQAASKGTIHKNAASRKVSRLAKRFNAAKTAQ